MPAALTSTAATTKLEPLADIDKRIKRTFIALEKMVNGIIKSHVRSLIVSGAAGCGKTYSVEKMLEAARMEGNIEYNSIKGSMSPPALYRELHSSSTEGQVLEIDDCDTIFGDLESLNLLKAALDTGNVRKVHWNKESAFLEAENLPRSFEFDGAAIFISNIDFASEIERDTKMSPHYEALLSRSMYVDLGIHSKREVLVRISQVVFTEEFLKANKITEGQAKDMIAWLQAHLTKLRTVSIRTVIHLAQIVKTDPDWKELAEVVMLRRIREIPR